MPVIPSHARKNPNPPPIGRHNNTQSGRVGMQSRRRPAAADTPSRCNTSALCRLWRRVRIYYNNIVRYNNRIWYGRARLLLYDRGPACVYDNIIRHVANNFRVPNEWGPLFLWSRDTLSHPLCHTITLFWASSSSPSSS